MSFKPVCRWNAPPYQRIDTANPLRLGVVAFSKAQAGDAGTFGKQGIASVAITPSGQGYSGGTKTVTYPSLNPDSLTWEHYVTISASEFTTNGQISITAVVTDLDGNTQTTDEFSGSGFDTINFQVNATGALAQLVAWVAPPGTGNDGTGAVGNSSLPYLNFGVAAAALQTAMGTSKVDGCIIKCKAGTYYTDGSGFSTTAVAVTTSQEWLTITRDDGLVQSDVKLQSNWVTIRTKLLRVYGVTLQNNNSAYPIVGNGHADPWAWAQGCHYDGTTDGGSRETSNGILAPDFNENGFVTECTMEEVRFPGAGCRFYRNVSIVGMANDMSQNCFMHVNVTVEDTDTTSGTHVDVIGDANSDGDPHNRIYYGIKGIDLHYQAIFCNTDQHAHSGTIQGVAFVNCFFELRATILPNGGSNGYFMQNNHFIMWGVSFCYTPAASLGSAVNTQGCAFYTHNDGPTPGTTTNQDERCWIGNLFELFQENISGTKTGDTESFENHFRRVPSGAHTFGTDYTTGDEVIETNTASADFGKPQSGSPLLNRLDDFPVAIDIEGSARPSTNATIGAFEMNSPASGSSSPSTSPSASPSTSVSASPSHSPSTSVSSSPSTSPSPSASVSSSPSTSPSHSPSTSPSTSPSPSSSVSASPSASVSASPSSSPSSSASTSPSASVSASPSSSPSTSPSPSSSVSTSPSASVSASPSSSPSGSVSSSPSTSASSSPSHSPSASPSTSPSTSPSASTSGDLVVVATSVLKYPGAKTDDGWAGETITAGQALYMSDTNRIMRADTSTWAKANCVGIALNGGTIYQPINYLKSGGINLGVLVAVGLAYGVSDTPGAISLISDRGSGDFNCLLGFAATPTRLEVTIVKAGVAI